MPCRHADYQPRRCSCSAELALTHGLALFVRLPANERLIIMRLVASHVSEASPNIVAQQKRKLECFMHPDVSGRANIHFGLATAHQPSRPSRGSSSTFVLTANRRTFVSSSAKCFTRLSAVLIAPYLLFHVGGCHLQRLSLPLVQRTSPFHLIRVRKAQD